MSLPSRPRCSWCREYYTVDFGVPKEIWKLVVREMDQAGAACLKCFTRMADERLVEWDKEITFHPISLARHAREVQTKAVAREGCNHMLSQPNRVDIQLVRDILAVCKTNNSETKKIALDAIDRISREQG